MTARLKHQVILIVGASSGMGRATALACAQAGAPVMAAARREDKLKELQQEASAAGSQLDVCVADVTRSADVDQLMKRTLERFGRIDTLVYATGTNVPDRALDVLSPDTWEMMLQTNLTGAFLCTKAVLPTMRRQGGGLMIYISTAAVQMPDISGVAYQSSKHGLSGLAHGTRVEEQSNGIRTSVIFPGLCDTEILSRRPTPTPQKILDQSLHPDDVAEAVVFIAGLPPRAVVPELQLLPSRL